MGIFLCIKSGWLFLLASMVVAIAVAIHGALIYPYWEELLKQPDTTSRIFLIGKFLRWYGFVFSDDVIIKVMITWWSLKGAVLEPLYTVGASYMIYCWYRNDYRRALDVMGKAIVCSLGCIILFSIVEIVAICGNQNAVKMVLFGDAILHWEDPKIIRPIDIPLLVWIGRWLKSGQVRSVFSEPSYLGIYAGFCISYLWYQIFKKLYWKNIFLTLAVSILVVLTNARTAIALHVGMLVLMGLFVLIKRRNDLLKKAAVIMICSGLAFCIGGIYVQHVNVRVLQNKVQQNKVQQNMHSIVQSNLLDITKVESRSNRSRFGYTVAAFYIGCKHPILGVGRIFRSGYMTENFPDWALKSGEIREIMARQKNTVF